MLELDHLAVVAPTLDEGVAHARESLGLDLPEGGRHREMGTRNHLLRLGDGVFLEVIAIDENAPAPERPRWFNLDDRATVRADWEAGRRLRAWVARTDDLPALLRRHGDLLGKSTRVSRGDRSWDFSLRADGRLPADGVASCVIDWGARGNPAPSMPDLGARLVTFEVVHPQPDACAERHRALGLRDPPIVTPGLELRLRAVIATPSGERVLT